MCLSYYTLSTYDYSVLSEEDYSLLDVTCPPGIAIVCEAGAVYAVGAETGGVVV